MRFPDFSLTDRVAIVTGGSRGIGRSIALAMANAGADVVVVAREAAPLEAVATEIGALGRRALPIACDVGNVAGTAALVEETVRAFGKVDILVNDAATSGALFAMPSDELAPEQWDKVLGVNLRGLFFLTMAAVRVMKSRKRGKIINIASAAGVRGTPNRIAYSSSKGGVIQITRALAVEVGGHGINVNCISPFYTRNKDVDRLLADPKFYQSLVAGIPLGRVGEPEDIAGAAVFLASSAADFVTGQNLMVDGGRGALL